MVYRGKVKDGVIVPPRGLRLAEGDKVTFEVVKAKAAPKHRRRSLASVFKNVIGKAQGLPADFAENHDHYIHGAPKRARK
jgi:hypothetical protein